MPKKMFSVFAFALAALASGVFAQVSIDVILRDFDVTAHGFEMFDGDEKEKGTCGGSWDGGRNTQTTDENAICFTSSGEYVYCKDRGFSSCEKESDNNCPNQLRYGGNGSTKGHCNGPNKENNFTCSEWGNYIFVTRDMVQKNLFYDKDNCPDDLIMQAPEGEPELPDFLKYRYCARPQKGNEACNSKDIENWFRDGEHTRTFRDTIMLQEQSDYTYLINYDANTRRNWNGNGTDNGYFPLDKYEGQDDIYGRRIYGMQSINTWCPPGLTQHVSGECTAWRNATSNTNNNNEKNPAKDPGAAKKAYPNSAKLHNYGFSMMGSASFKYQGNSTDVFEFIGDDDMWIFIDGELAVDLGGVHLAAPAKIKIEDLARDRDWEPGSMHAVNFFYMDRNTDGSNMRLRVALNEMSSSIFVGPYIKEAKTIQNSDGSSKTTIYVNVKINKSKIEEFLNSNNFPIIITTSDPNDKDIRGFKLESISDPEYLGSDKGYAYVITGQVCKSPTECGGLIINSGDSLSFNVLRDDIRDPGYRDNGFGLPSEDWYIIADGTRRPANKIQWAPNSTALPPVDFKPIPGDENPWKPDFVDQWFTGNPNGGTNDGGAVGNGFLDRPDGRGPFPDINKIFDPKTKQMVDIPKRNETVHGFGSKGIAIPPNRAGELLLTAYPYAGGNVNGTSYAEWQKDETLQKLFGLPPEPDGKNYFGIADPTVLSKEGGYVFVKNGFPGESSVGGRIQIAPTRCISDKSNPDKPRINCLNFSLLAKQPFRIAVTVYDQLGNFVTQYREEVNEQEFRSAVQGPSYVDGSGIDKMDPSDKCKRPTTSNYGNPNTMTVNGLVKVNVNIYPFSADGRRFGNGVYLLKIDRVDLPYEGCAASGGNALWIEEPFVRYHADTKFGWARSKAKDKAK